MPAIATDTTDIAENTPAPAFNRRMVTLTVMLGATMAIIDTSIVNVALPTIGEDLRATVDELSMVATGFIIAGVLMMPLTGWMNAFFGRKRFFMLSLAFFVLASIACGLAWNVESLALFRVLQGLGGGTLVPVSQAIMLSSYPREQHGKAMSIFGMGVTAGPAVGPVLGGWLTAHYSWHWIFFINVPIGLLAWRLAGRFLHDEQGVEKPRGRFDWAGLTAMILGLSAAQLVLEKGHRLGWFQSAPIVMLSVLTVVALVYFIRREFRVPNPIVNLSVLRNRTFALSCLIGLVMGVGLLGVLIILPLFMVDILAYDALTVGMALSPGAVFVGLMTPLSGFLTDRIDPRGPIAVGVVLSAINLYCFSLVQPDAPLWVMPTLMAFRGVGLGLLFVPLTALAMNGIATRDMAGASGLFTLIRQLGGSFGIAILTGLLVFFQNTFIQSMSPLRADQLAYEILFRLSAGAFLLCLIPLVLMRRAHAEAEKLG